MNRAENRYRIEWIPRRSWQTGVDAEDQRWTVSPNLFVGTEVEMTRELSELELTHDRAVVFRAVPLLAECGCETDCEADVENEANAEPTRVAS